MTIRIILSALVCLSSLLHSRGQQMQILVEKSIEAEPKQESGFPVLADILSQNQYTPEFSNRYFISVFGPRILGSRYDFHQGSDITPNLTYGGKNFDSSNKIPIISMTEGTIDKIIDGSESYLESIGTGRSVRVKTNLTFPRKPEWGTVYINYRHLSQMGNIPAKFEPDDPDATEISISKEDTVGIMGESGTTTNVHLHWSVARKTDDGYKNVHPMRLFRQDLIPHLITGIDTAWVYHDNISSNSALVRVAVPYNQTVIGKVSIAAPFTSGETEKVFDLEAVSYDSDNRDDNEIVPGLAVYAYPFNKGHSAYKRYESVKDNLSLNHPASGQRPPEFRFEIPNEAPFDQPVYVLDFVVEDLPPNYDPFSLLVEITDIYGNAIKAALGLVTVIEDKSSAVSIYPNPATNRLFVSVGDDFFGGRITLSDISGRLLVTTDISDDGPIEITTSNLSSGIYIIHILGGPREISKKVFVD